ncbi:TonB-dependent receptor [Filimonas effusa]|uniref:Outer membrane protein beta-barrel domain-containing protein n=1 Tax=Filimonas effusa TaxID=2508721 RepID=A0A4Q1D108_9BACT|nr:TonB-dependent receptor [Filimonas effusa]RXK81409.1 hypothetical protein ESB13_20970 [Filimonas effusa]
MNKLSATLVCLVFVCVSFGQSATMKGQLLDSFNQQRMPNAAVALLHAKDSVMYAFERTDAGGNFNFKQVNPGKYVLLITAPNYADYADTFMLAENANLDLKTIPLLLKARLLEDVVVRQTVAAIKIKGDTTEFKADSFQVRANASVEELLKKLPGIKVDKDGKISVFGETVERVLVDGEEFFGNDPTLVTQNLRADMVDKVQVYDKKSDQATFTGIEDGERSKTINLKLKEDKKRGYFGKLNIGRGTDGFYDMQAMFNLFRNKERLSVFGISSTTGTMGLNWQDEGKFGQAEELNYNEEEGYFTGSDNWDGLWAGYYDNRGLPDTKTAGVHYDTKWDGDKQKLNGNYKMQDLTIVGQSTQNTQYLLPDSSYYNNSVQSFSNQALRHNVNGAYDWQVDSSSSFKVTALGTWEHKETTEDNSSNSLAMDKSLVNQNNRRTTNEGDARVFNSDMIWRKKYRKTGRSLSAAFSQKYRSNEGEGYLRSNTSFYNISGTLDSTQFIDQLKVNRSERLTLDGNVTYSEPLSATSFLIANYGVVVDNNDALRSSYNKINDKYELLDSTYSSNYRFNIFTHKGGLSYKYVKNKIRVSIGGNIGVTSFRQNDLYRNNIRTRDFINWFPKASLNYTIGKTGAFVARYEGRTQQPNINDIQPLQANDNPLFITMGNPDLKPSFNNRIELNYRSYQALKQRFLYTGMYLSSTNNAISWKNTIDEAGKTFRQAVNLNGNWNTSFRAMYGFKLKKLNLDLRPGFNVSYGRTVNYVNGLLGKNNNTAGNIDLSIGRSSEKVEFYVYGSLSYTHSKSSLQLQQRTNYWTSYIEPGISWKLPWRLVLATDMNISLRQKLTPDEPDNNVVLWKASIEKKFMKSEALSLKVSVNDILNQNNGFNRSANNNMISQSTYTTIRRYGQLSVIWNFNKMGGVTK